MGIKIQRVRYNDDNRLAVELCIGTKHISPDVLATRYKENGESKYLVSPSDALSCAFKIIKRWHNDYSDELKSIALVNADGKGTRAYFDPLNKNDVRKLEKWATSALAAMDKCGHCGRVIGSSTAFHEHESIPGKAFCSDNCLGSTYRDIFKTELPKISTPTKKRK